MAIVEDKIRELKAFSLNGKFAFPCELGEYYLGVSFYGEKNEMSGVYQTRHCKNGRKIVRMKYAAPPKLESEAILASRASFKEGMKNWALSSNEVKLYWKTKAKPLQMHGHNLFIKQYMLSH